METRVEGVLKKANAQIEKDEAEYKRQKGMLPKGATSEKAVQRAEATYEVSVEQRNEAVAGLTQAKATLAQSEADLAKARANRGAPGDANAVIRAAQAAAEQAELDLEFTQVRASVDGYVTNLSLQIGSREAGFERRSPFSGGNISLH
jgi:multidrug resistance efflux pump